MFLPRWRDTKVNAESIKQNSGEDNKECESKHEQKHEYTIKNAPPEISSHIWRRMLEDICEAVDEQHFMYQFSRVIKPSRMKGAPKKRLCFLLPFRVNAYHLNPFTRTCLRPMDSPSNRAGQFVIHFSAKMDNSSAPTIAKSTERIRSTEAPAPTPRLFSTHLSSSPIPRISPRNLFRRSLTRISPLNPSPSPLSSESLAAAARLLCAWQRAVG
jgi:hypothetical protein